MNESTINIWLREKLATLDTRGMKSPELKVSSDPINCAGAVAFDLDGNFECGHAATIDAAFAELRRKIPLDVAEQLRSRAARLIAQAEKMEAAK